MDNILNIVNEYSIFIVLGLAVITILLFLITIILMISVSKVNKRYKKMMRGSKGRNIEELINSNLDRIEEAVENSQKSLEITNGCVNKVAIMRYKAFEDVGSDLSFSIALLDSHNDGIVLTGIYSRQDSTTYAKPIDKGISRYELSEEELHVLNEAMSKE